MTRKTFLLSVSLGLALGLVSIAGGAGNAAADTAAPKAKAEKKPGKADKADKADKKAKKGDLPMVVIKTSLGTIKAELYPDKAPLSVKNFLDYVNDKFYDGTIFHRVINGFMIQGGGFDANMRQKDTKPPVKNEAANGLKNLNFTLAMARTSIPDSATSQFFINVNDNVPLDFKDPSPGGIGYCVFGKVVDGTDVVKKIRDVQTGVKNGMRDVPVTTVTIESVRLDGRPDGKPSSK